MVNRRLEYCNSLLHRTSSSNINKLQRVQNSIARIITRRQLSDPITPVLADLHWLPVQYRIQYELAVITFKVLTTQQPRYLHDLIRSHASTRQLLSDGEGLLQVDRVNSVFAERAFRYSAPTVWNSMSQHLKSDLSNFPTFNDI